MGAILYGALECVRPLIHHGADVNKSNYIGQTPLHYAVRKKFMGSSTKELDSVINFLKEKNAIVNLSSIQYAHLPELRNELFAVYNEQKSLNQIDEAVPNTQVSEVRSSNFHIEKHIR